MADPRHARGLIDTSVVIDLELIDAADLPGEVAVSAITMAELAAGPHATTDPAERARRQDRLQRAEATFEALPVDTAVARAYGRVYAAVGAAGRKARGRRAVDLFIAAVIFWVFSGVWMWWELKTTRRWGALAAVGGIALFGVFLIAL